MGAFTSSMSNMYNQATGSQGGAFGGGLMPGNPSAGSAMPGFQEGFQPELTQEQQNTIGNQTNMFTQSMQQPLPGYQLNTNTVFPGNQQQPMTQGDGQLPPGFGALSPIDRSQINPSASIGMPSGGLFSKMFGTVMGGVGQAFQNAASQPGLTTQQQQAVNAVGNTFGTSPLGFGGGKSAPTQAPTPLMGGMGSFTNVQSPMVMPPPGVEVQPFPEQFARGPAPLPGVMGWPSPGPKAKPITQPAPGQNPSVMGWPVQQPNRFIPPNAPGASARRPTPGIPFPGQTGLTRPRVAPQPLPMNRFTRNRLR
jgi:hypothetical protein